ncbi:hypothetical protein [Nonomuraea candida]|uniref:hypothetical protein n=1 Tax=Nonomuraea candida TaxID=359159 RepID=UPI0005B9E46F|nr:hypothetical protein [Nonomuraea candida]
MKRSARQDFHADVIFFLHDDGAAVAGGPFGEGDGGDQAVGVAAREQQVQAHAAGLVSRDSRRAVPVTWVTGSWTGTQLHDRDTASTGFLLAGHSSLSLSDARGKTIPACGEGWVIVTADRKADLMPKTTT